MSTIVTFWKKKGISFFIKNERNIIFGVSLLLISLFSFELGTLYTLQKRDNVLVIEKPTLSLAQIKENAGIPNEGAVAGVMTTGNEKQITINQGEVKKDTAQSNCVFVGSKNSNKYHSPSCSYAKRIKPENKVCFKDTADAEGKGYIAGCLQ